MGARIKDHSCRDSLPCSQVWLRTLLSGQAFKGGFYCPLPYTPACPYSVIYNMDREAVLNHADDTNTLGILEPQGMGLFSGHPQILALLSYNRR